MQTEEFDFISIGETKIRGKIWLPDKKPQAILCVIHGLGEHSGRYDHFANYFVDEKIAVYCIDLRGHGLSENKKGHASVADLLEDVQELVITARRDYNNLPIYLFGQSMGGNILANYLIKYSNSEISGAIFSSSWFKLKNLPSSFFEKAGRFFKNIVPFFTMPNGILVTDLMHDPKQQAAYSSDPLVHNRTSLKLYFDLKKSANNALAKAESIQVRTLVCHGDADNITSYQGSIIFSERLKNAAIKIWEGEKHEPHHDYHSEKIIGFYVGWVKDQLAW